MDSSAEDAIAQDKTVAMAAVVYVCVGERVVRVGEYVCVYSCICESL